MKHSGYQKITRVELFCFIPKWNDPFLLSECRIGLRFFSLQTSASFKQKVLLLKNPSNSKSGLALTLGTVGSIQPHWDDLSGLYLSPHCPSSHGPCQRPAQPPPKTSCTPCTRSHSRDLYPQGCLDCWADCRKLCWWKLAVPPKCRSPVISFPRWLVRICCWSLCMSPRFLP